MADKPEFQRFLETWNRRIEQRTDVFFGYSSGATDTANLFIQFLETIGVKVRSWQTDFRPAGTILDEIEETARNLRRRHFLFFRGRRPVDWRYRACCAS